MEQRNDDGNGLNAQLYYTTRSLCPVCEELVPGRIVPREQRVYIERTCPTHGASTGLICSDQAWYERLPLFFTDGVKPGNPLSKPKKGCPEDCGLCAGHNQIAGTAAIEISNICNGSCPSCLANNRGTFQLSVKDVEDAVVAVLKNQDHVDAVTLSGGEPTIHPQLFEIIRAVRRKEVTRIVVNSNGIRIAENEDFVKRLAAENVLVSLHYDGRNAAKLRGVEHAVQQKAVDQLARHGIGMVPVVLAAKGVNDGELGSIVEHLLLKYPAVKGLILSMMTYAGSRGTHFPGDPMTRLTIPEALDAIEKETGGRISKSAFMPLPMPNPMCAAMGYFLLMDNEMTPLIPYGEIEDVVARTKNGHFGSLTADFGEFLKETINRIYANPGKYPNGERVSKKFRKLLELAYPQGRALTDAERARIADEHLRVVYLMQFMDAWTFDSKRLSRCSCQHVLPGGKIVPSCGYYSYHRRFDKRFA